MNLLELINKTKAKISDESYKKYAKYYNLTEPTDNEFNRKLEIIYDLIINKKYDDIASSVFNLVHNAERIIKK